MPLQPYSHWKCHTSKPVVSDSKRMLMSTATVTTQHLRPRFSTFLVLFTGKNSRPSSKPFMFWTEKGSAAQ